MCDELNKKSLKNLAFFPCRKSEIEYYAMLGKAGVHHFAGTNIELGNACGKLYRVTALSITDQGGCRRDQGLSKDITNKIFVFYKVVNG